MTPTNVSSAEMLYVQHRFLADLPVPVEYFAALVSRSRFYQAESQGEIRLTRVNGYVAVRRSEVDAYLLATEKRREEASTPFTASGTQAIETRRRTARRFA